MKPSKKFRTIGLALVLGTAGLLTACTEADYKKVNEELQLTMKQAAEANKKADEKSAELKDSETKEEEVLEKSKDVPKSNDAEHSPEEVSEGPQTPPNPTGTENHEDSNAPKDLSPSSDGSDGGSGSDSKLDPKENSLDVELSGIEVETREEPEEEEEAKEEDEEKKKAAELKAAEEKKAAEARQAQLKGFQELAKVSLGTYYSDIQAVAVTSTLSQVNEFFTNAASFDEVGSQGFVGYGFSKGEFNTSSHSLITKKAKTTDATEAGTSDNVVERDEEQPKVSGTTAPVVNTNSISLANGGGGDAGGDGAGGVGTPEVPAEPAEEKTDEATPSKLPEFDVTVVKSKASTKEHQTFLGFKTSYEGYNFAAGVGLVRGSVKIGTPTASRENIANGSYHSNSLFFSVGKGFKDYYANVGLFLSGLNYHLYHTTIDSIQEGKTSAFMYGLNLNGGYKVFADENQMVTVDAGLTLGHYSAKAFTESAVNTNKMHLEEHQAMSLSFKKNSGMVGSLNLGANYVYKLDIHSFTARLEAQTLLANAKGFQTEVADGGVVSKALPGNFTAKLKLGYAVEVTPGLKLKLAGSVGAGSVTTKTLHAGLEASF